MHVNFSLAFIVLTGASTVSTRHQLLLAASFLIVVLIAETEVTVVVGVVPVGLATTLTYIESIKQNVLNTALDRKCKLQTTQT